MAVQEPRLLLFGDYQEPGLARLVHLGASGSCRVTKKASLVDTAGKGFDRARAIGVGNSLYLFRDRQVFVADVW